MRNRTRIRGVLIGLATVGSILTISFSVGQPPGNHQKAPSLLPPSVTSNPPVKAADGRNDVQDATDIRQMSASASSLKPCFSAAQLNDLPPFLQQNYQVARNGASWLARMQKPATGRFIHGWVPALNAPLDGDQFLHQAEATIALAHAARFFGSDSYLLRARQAVLSLMSETSVDPSDSNARYTAMPVLVVNRLAAAGLLLAAIHELHEPAPDLLQQGEQLATYIRKQQRADGSLCCNENPAVRPSASDLDANLRCPGMALFGLMRSMRHRPAPWKLEVVRRALPSYQAACTANPDPACVYWCSATFAEAFMQTKERPFATLVMAVNDWLCTLQYGPENARSPKWIGGFKGSWPEQGGADAPCVGCAIAAQSLLEACRVCRHLPDGQRYDRYKSAAGFSMHFLSQLQFTDDATHHFAPNFREVLLGGFHNSHQDGNLSVAAQARVVGAILVYLELAADK